MRNTLLSLLFVGACPVMAGVPESPSESESAVNKNKTLLEWVMKEKAPELSSHMNLEFCTSAGAYFTDWSLDEADFKLNRVRWEVKGKFGKGFSYHFRQSFNKYSNPHALDKLSSSVEYAFVKWDMKKRFALTAGKQILLLGGYEYWVNSMKVREFSDFNNNINCYQAGVTGEVTVTPTQQLNFQVLNNRNGSDEDTYLYGLPAGVKKAKVPLIATANWDGYFFDSALNLRYSFSYGQLAEKRPVYYLTAGNVWKRGPVLAYVDFMYSREGLDSKGLISELPAFPEGKEGTTAQHTEYFTTIANLDYRVHPNWNIYVKGAYETGGVFKANGMYEEGLYRKTWNVQTCAEFYPMKNSELQIYLHLLYKKNSLTERARLLGASGKSTQRVSLGLVYTIPVF